jgi:hypothetical protein
MKSLHLVAIVVAVIATEVVTVVYVRAKTDEVMTSSRAISADSEKAVERRLDGLATSMDQRTEALQKAISGSITAAVSDTAKTFNARLSELDTSMTSKIEEASATTSRRFDAVEKSLGSEFAKTRSLLPAHLRADGEVSIADLSGQWEVTFPSGSTTQASITRLEGGQYRLMQARVFNGIYGLNKDRLVAVDVAANKPAMFVWKVQDEDDLILVESSSQNGGNYKGTTMKRVR